MTGPIEISREQAAEAVRANAHRVDDLDLQDYGRVLIHTFRGPFGADWDADDALRTIAKATRCAWVDSLTGHHLAVLGPDGKITAFACPLPEGVEL